MALHRQKESYIRIGQEFDCPKCGTVFGIYELPTIFSGWKFVKCPICSSEDLNVKMVCYEDATD